MVVPGWTVHSGPGAPWDVTTTCFTDEPRLQRLGGLHPPRKQIQAPPASLAETTPFAHQSGIHEESRFDREHIESTPFSRFHWKREVRFANS